MSEEALGALNGLKVIDFGQYMAGPMAAMYLADDGADVIRIEHPSGPLWDTPANAFWNCGKRSIQLDLKTDDGLAAAKRLVENADVLVENFRPGVMDRLGLGAEALSAVNPRLIYLSLPGFGRSDPRAHLRAWEGVLGAATGAFRPAVGDEDERPAYTIMPYASAFGAFLGAGVVAAALFERQSSGVGQSIEVPLFNAAFSAIGIKGMLVHNHPEAPPAFNWTRQALAKDGRWFMSMSSNKRFRAFLEGTGLSEPVDANASADELTRQFNALFASRSAADWEIFCAEIGTEGVTCLTSSEWMGHPQARISKTIITLDDPLLGTMSMPGRHVDLSACPGRIMKPRPLFDQHRDEIMAELDAVPPASAAAQVEAERAPSAGSALNGIRVLDLCIILAGPTCGRTLAELGADVVKIDSPHLPRIKLHNDINRGKRSLLLDLKSTEGKELFWSLVDRADVVLQNFRSGVAEALGIGYDDVRARRPDIVYCSLNTYGQSGPYADRPGHEQIVQAATGMQLRFGGDRPVLAPFAANDYGTGLMAAYAVILALMHRRRTGEGQHVTNALARTATILQSNVMHAYPGKIWNEPSDQECLGSGPLCRAYQTEDGWLFLQCRPHEAAHCPEIRASSHDEAEMEALLKTRSTDDWMLLLGAAGIGVHPLVLDIHALMNDPDVRRMGLSLLREHDVVGPVTTTGPGITLSRSPVQPGQPASAPGSDALSILDDLGLSDRLPDLLRQRVVVMDGVSSI